MEFKRTHNVEVPYDGHNCRVTRMNDLLEVKTMTARPIGVPACRKISADQYVLIETGEIKDYKHGENRADNWDGLRGTFRKIRRLINNNFKGAPNELMITFTYAENMTDAGRLYTDFDKFMKKLRYRYPDLDYLLIVEPQGRGAWHGHLLLRFNALDRVFIPDAVIAKLWGHGFTTTKGLNNVDNIGAYITAYLADIEYNPDIPHLEHDVITKTVTGDDGKPIQKKFIKGGRCHMYPPGMNIYRHSKGIIPPTTEDMPYTEVKKIVGSKQPDYTTKTEILDGTGSTINTIRYYSYNLKRSSKPTTRTKEAS